MSLSDKITMLRKSRALSQEELAERLGISRQAVSKWESGQSMPDIDKIVLLSEFFGVTTDYLLKDTNDNVSEEKEESEDFSVLREEDEDVPEISDDEIKKIISEKYREAKLISMAVLLFILSPLALICLLSIADYGILKEPFALGIGLFVLFFLVTLGVGLCIYSGVLTSAYKPKLKAIPLSPVSKTIYESEISRTEKRRRISYILGTSLTIISPLPIIFYAIFDEFKGLASEKQYLFFPLCMSFLFVCVSAGVFLLANIGVRDDALKLLKPRVTSGKKTLTGEIIDIYWTALPFIYLLISFLTGRWEITWIIWPLSPIIPQIISLFRRRR